MTDPILSQTISRINFSKEILSEMGFEDFRNGQQEVILKVLKGKNILLAWPGGSGKSLCYQVSLAVAVHSFCTSELCD